VKKTRFDFSPSINHRHVMDTTVPALRYEGGDVRVWQRKLRRKVRELVGLHLMERAPLNVRSLWKRDHPLGTIEKLVFTSEPRADVPGFLCLPRNARPPYPVMVCVQGHTTGMHVSIAVQRDDNRKPFKVEGDRDFGLGCMARGVAALCIEQRSFGERGEQVQRHVSEHGCHDATMHALMLGRTMIGERVFDVDRAIDYLETRNDMDLRRLGIMGNSGGGTISLFSAALLRRIQFAMPSCYFCTFRDSIMSIYHCMDNYVPGLLLHAEMPDVMGLFAPRPVVLVAGKADDIFPISGVRKAFRHLKTIYRAASAEDRCHLVVGTEGHQFYADLAWPKALRELKRLG
jgi:dienelactone hydrolase